MALLVAAGAPGGVGLPVAAAGAVAGGGRRLRDLGGEVGALGGDLLGGGGRGERGPYDDEGEAEPDGDRDLGGEAQRRAPPPPGHEGGGAAGRAAEHRHPAAAAVGGAEQSGWRWTVGEEGEEIREEQEIGRAHV